METTQNETKPQTSNAPSLWVDVKKARLTRDKQYLIIELADGRLVRKHINYFKALLGLHFTPKAKSTEVKQAVAAPAA